MPVAVQAPTLGPIQALVARHAADAAFYWQLHDTAEHSPLQGLSHLREFDRLLCAHLDGLRVAGQAGWLCALAQLQRWRGAPETFVASLLALESPAPGPRLAAVWAVVEADPDRSMRGLISAMAWAGPDAAAAWCSQWLGLRGQHVGLAVAAWRTIALYVHGHAHEDEALGPSLHQALGDEHAALRAAAARAAAVLDVRRLWPLLDDPDEVVRAEAAMGILSSPPSDQVHLPPSDRMRAAEVLWAACEALGHRLPNLTGWHRASAERRLQRWVNELAVAVPMQHPDVATLLQLLPQRLGLWFTLHHGDPFYLPWVIERMDSPEASRLAGWTWSAMTDVDWHRQGLALPPRELDQAVRPTDNLDPGLPEPDRQRVASVVVQLPDHRPCLGGRELDPPQLQALLTSGAPQAIRWIAARRLRQLGHPSLDTRAPAHVQQQWLRDTAQLRSQHP